MQHSSNPATTPEAAPKQLQAQIFTVYLRASARHSDEHGYRNAVCAEDVNGAITGEILDYPVLRKSVLAYTPDEAIERFNSWQAEGLPEAWLIDAEVGA